MKHTINTELISVGTFEAVKATIYNDAGTQISSAHCAVWGSDDLAKNVHNAEVDAIRYALMYAEMELDEHGQLTYEKKIANE